MEMKINIVKQTAKELGLTYKQLGDAIGVKEGTINKIASTGEVSEPMQKAIELYCETIELKKELQEYKDFKNFIKKLAN